MSFDSKITIFIFLIAFCWQYGIVYAKRIPLTIMDTKMAVECLQDNIENDFIEEWFQKKLTYGEYIEEFCKDKSIPNVIEKMTKYSSKNLASDVKTCLEDYGYNGVYEDYYNFGLNEFHAFYNQNADTTFSPVVSENESNIKNEVVGDVENPQTIKSYQSAEDQQGTHKNDSNENEILNISIFVIGICQKDKPMNWDELEVDVDKNTTMNCLVQGLTELFEKFEDILMEGKEKIKEFRETNGLTEEALKSGKIGETELLDEIRYHEEQSKIDREILAKFQKDFYRSKKKDLQTITNLGKKVLKQYGEVYVNEKQYLSKVNTYLKLETISQIPEKGLSDDEKHHKNLEHKQVYDQKVTDSRLSKSFVYYKSFAKRQCFMKTSSLPLYDYIYDVALGVVPIDETKLSAQTDGLTLTDDKAKTSQSSVTDHTTLVGKAEFEPQLAKFFKVLINEDDERGRIHDSTL